MHTLKYAFFFQNSGLSSLGGGGSTLKLMYKPAQITITIQKSVKMKGHIVENSGFLKNLTDLDFL